MARRRQRLWWLASAAFAAAAVAVSTAWVWGQYRTEYLWPSPTGRWGVTVTSDCLTAWVNDGDQSPPDDRHDGPLVFWDSGATPGPNVRWTVPYLARLESGSAAGIGSRYVEVRYLPLVIATAAAGVGCGWVARRRRLPPGHCRRCGYDLRASPGRCPECGAEPIAG